MFIFCIFYTRKYVCCKNRPTDEQPSIIREVNLRQEVPLYQSSSGGAIKRRENRELILNH